MNTIKEAQRVRKWGREFNMKMMNRYSVKERVQSAQELLDEVQRELDR